MAALYNYVLNTAYMMQQSCKHIMLASYNLFSLMTDITVCKILSMIHVVLGRGGSVVRASDWQSSGRGFESHWGRLKTLAISFTPLCQCLSEETLKAVGTFYLVSMPEEV